MIARTWKDISREGVRMMPRWWWVFGWDKICPPISTFNRACPAATLLFRKGRCTHLSVWNWASAALDHSMQLLTSLCKRLRWTSRVVLGGETQTKFESSANNVKSLVVDTSGRVLMVRLKRRGLRWVPWGTPCSGQGKGRRGRGTNTDRHITATQKVEKQCRSWGCTPTRQTLGY